MLSLINCSTKAAKVQADGEIGIVGQEGKLPCSIGRTALMVVSVLPCQMERPIRASNYAGAPAGYEGFSNEPSSVVDR